jgi:RNA polymerase sigma-70 factor (ECF subfamily)
MEPATGVPIERLLEHREWVRRLARALVYDESRADDVEQDAWLAALRHPPRHDTGLKSWLRRLVRHRVANARRAATRRKAHESIAPPQRHDDTPDDAVAQIEELQRVTRAVLALDEPYRTVVALRFYEDLDAHAIAARLSVPVETVRTRLKRALVRLRERLDEEHGGDGRAWCAALLPLAADAARAKTSLITGGIAVTTKTKLALAAAVLLVLALAGGVAVVAIRSGDEAGADRSPGTDTATAAAAPHRPARGDAKPAADALLPAPAGSASVFGAVRFGESRKPAVEQRVVLSTPGAAPVETRTDDRGRFRFDRLATLRPWRVAVNAEGFAPVVAANLRLEADEVRDVGVLWLDAPARLDVVVKDWGDRPVAGAAVQLFPDSERGLSFDSWNMAAALRDPLDALAVATSDQGGRATFPALPRGRWMAVVRAAGFALGVRQGLTVPPVEPVTEFEVRLDHGERIAGRVLHADRSPAPGFVVWHPRDNWYLGSVAACRAVSDADGRFTMEGVPYGDAHLLVGAPGRAPAEAALVRVPTGAPVEIVLDGNLVEGRVVDADGGGPLSGARVRLNVFAKSDRASWVAEAVTGEDGRYHVDTIRDGGVFTIRVERPGYAVLTDSPAGGLAFRDGRATRDFTLRRGVHVAGIVAGPGGPDSGTRIAASWWCGQGGLARVEGFTGDDGRFALTGVAPGTVVLHVVSEAAFQQGLTQNWIADLFQQRKPAGSIEVPPEGRDDIAITLVAGVQVTGRVEDADGAAAGGAFVQSAWTSVRSSDDGTFRIAVEPRAEGVSLTAFKDAAASEPVHVAVDRPVENVVLRLQRPVRFSGRVTTESGAVTETASVQVIFAPSSRQRWGNDEQQWARVPVLDGRYSAEVSPPKDVDGRIRIRASAPGFASADSAQIALPFDRAEYTADLTLAPARPFEGRVLSSADRSAVVGARISILPKSWVPDPNDSTPRALGAVTDAEGRFRMDGVPNGDLKLEVTHEEFVRTVVPITQPADDIVLTVERALAIAGTVKLAGGGPVAKASVTLHLVGDVRNETWRWTNSDAEGRFRIGGLASGAYVVSVTQPGDGSTSARPWESNGVEAGTADLVVEMESAASISGRVVDPAGKPVASCSVQAYSETGDRYTPSDQTKDDGTFCVRGLGTGTYALVAHPRSPVRLLPARVTGIPSGADGVEIRLTAGETIRGRLMDSAGAPVGAALLRADELQTSDPWTRAETPSVFTEPSGAFAFEGVPAGRYRIVHVVDANALGGIRPLRGGEDVASGAADVRLVAGGVTTISGTVVDEDGRPVASASVTATPVGGGPRCGARTDATGAFTIANTSELVRYSLRARVNDRPPVFAADVAPGAAGIVLKVTRGRETSGRVLLADGTPYANGYLEFALEGTDWRDSTKTDSEGRFTVNSLPEGGLRVMEMFVSRRYGERMTPRTCGTIRAGDKDVVLKFTE